MRVWLVVLLLTLSACTTLPPPPATAPGSAERQWRRHQQSLADIDAFRLQGRLADGSGRSANLDWQQHADGRFTLNLRGPLGIGAVSIEGDAHSVIVHDKQGAHPTDDPQGWMWAHLGWALPLDALRHWALGLPAPGLIDQLTLNAEGQLLDLQQQDWTLRYDAYQTVGLLTLPRRLQAQSQTIRLRLVMDRWAVTEPHAAPSPPAASTTDAPQ